MSEFTELKEEVEKLKREVEEFKRARFANAQLNDVASIKEMIFERTAATLASGASLSSYLIVTHNGKRKAIPTYNKFSPLV